MCVSPCTVATVSVPLTASYQEAGGGTGTVMVCATLSGVTATTQTPISITLATNNSSPGRMIKLNFAKECVT